MLSQLLEGTTATVKVLLTAIALLWSGLVGLAGYVVGQAQEHSHPSINVDIATLKTRVESRFDETNRRLERIERALDEANSRE